MKELLLMLLFSILLGLIFTQYTNAHDYTVDEALGYIINEDYEQALYVLNHVIEYNGNTYELSEAYYFKGKVLFELGDEKGSDFALCKSKDPYDITCGDY